MTRSAECAALPPVAGYLESNGPTSTVVYSLTDEVADPIEWLVQHRDSVRAIVARHGAVLFRNLPTGLESFQDIVATLGGDPLAYHERSTPRTEVGGNIYTSTEYPPDQRIPMHNENSYADSWPTHLYFLCVTRAEEGGETPIADSRSVFDRIAPEIRSRFSDGVVYTRTFREGLGLSWQETFQTTSRAEVERFCRTHGHHFEWDGAVLRTKTHRPAWRDDPHSGRSVWFNQAHLFHVSALEPDVRDALLLAFDERDLPRNAYYADGSPLRPDDLAAIEQVYRDCALTLHWEPGDLLMVDNMQMAHSRTPYRGQRRILVAMT